jgi:hypothetical protein
LRLHGHQLRNLGGNELLELGRKHVHWLGRNCVTWPSSCDIRSRQIVRRREAGQLRRRQCECAHAGLTVGAQHARGPGGQDVCVQPVLLQHGRRQILSLGCALSRSLGLTWGCGRLIMGCRLHRGLGGPFVRVHCVRAAVVASAPKTNTPNPRAMRTRGARLRGIRSAVGS